MISDQMRVAIDAYLQDPKSFWVAISELKEDASVEAFGEAKIGDKIIVRAVTFHYIGTLSRVNGAFITLREVQWVNTTGPWQEFLDAKDQVGDLESYRHDDWVMIQIASIVDMSPAPAFANKASRKSRRA